MTTDPLRVVVADDHPVFRGGLQDTLNDEPAIADLRRHDVGRSARNRGRQSKRCRLNVLENFVVIQGTVRGVPWHNTDKAHDQSKPCASGRAQQTFALIVGDLHMSLHIDDVLVGELLGDAIGPRTTWRRRKSDVRGRESCR